MPLFVDAHLQVSHVKGAGRDHVALLDQRSW